MSSADQQIKEHKSSTKHTSTKYRSTTSIGESTRVGPRVLESLSDRESVGECRTTSIGESVGSRVSESLRESDHESVEPRVSESLRDRAKSKSGDGFVLHYRLRATPTHQRL